METLTKPIYHFNIRNTTINPQIAVVGGKGHSLITMMNAGLKVPPGFALGVEFFSSWVDFLKTSEHWKRIVNSNDESIYEENLNQMKNLCYTTALEFSNQQRDDLYEAMKSISAYKIFAVRSSSPEEDLEGASFAGGYETVLCVTYEKLESAIKRTFASCLDYRVFKYKKERGFQAKDFKISIIIMAQVSSEISGVGFSLNPSNNDFDEAVVTSNWGLGETVVGGIVSADEYIINKVTKEIIETKIGKKEKSIFVNENGGTTEQEKFRSEDQTLTKENLMQLLALILRVENFYNKPMDIEWAIEDNVLYLLQARPITAYYALPKEMMTEPGNRRNLYLDIWLVVQGFDKPSSTLGSTLINEIFRHIGLKVLGSDDLFNLHTGIGIVIGGRVFFNLSNLLAKANKQDFVKNFSKMSTVSAKIVEESSPSYIAQNSPNALNFSKLGMAWRLPITKFIFPNFLMKYTKRNILSNPIEFQNEKERLIFQYKNNQISFRNLIHTISCNFGELFCSTFLPAVFGGIACGFNKIMIMFETFANEDPSIKLLVNDLVKSLPGNVTTMMGLELYKVGQCLAKEREFYIENGIEYFLNDFNQRKLGDEFYEKFDEYVTKYGFRGEAELDIKSQRFEDNPQEIVKQIYNILINSTDESNPVAVFENAEKSRPEVYAKLYQLAEKNNFHKDFQKAYELCCNLGGFRETPKYNAIAVLSSIRKLVLTLAQVLIDQGLIDTVERIFDLSYNDLLTILESKENLTKETVDKMIHNSNVDRNIFLKWAKTPPIIDSRGRILTCKPQPVKPGELAGQSVSWGTVKGRVKVMHTVNEKNFYTGEILVAKATDPGWTLLIINSGGIVLEIGGMLQHGALVSREFGKPCVVGIENVTNLLQDGELVEVDAVNGIVRKIEE